ncbi:alkaline ceramidase [Tachypleus tridentatus]|uniref:alkaline ceramidase n=1 Tax=Tachypleus tridentatus TaxID=6853 RepID=UPI003FD60EDF
MGSSLVLQRGSSAVDWCERNYIVTSGIAEFVNTVSNVLFLILPPLLLRLFHQYAKCVSSGIILIWSLLLLIGLSSAYFHATLSLLGQLLDELAILWLLMACFAMWVPRRYLPLWFRGERKTFQKFVAILCAVGTVLVCIYPAVNAFALMAFGIPITCLLIIELKRCNNPRVFRLGIRSAFLWGLALCCWINDRLFCDMWSSLNFPYLHGAWHLLIAIAATSGCVLFAYFDACIEVPDQYPALIFWPYNGFELGVPYIILRSHCDPSTILMKYKI